MPGIAQTKNKVIDWLLKGDVAIQYQVYRDLLSEHREDLRNRIASEGWGFKFLSRQNDNGHWGKKFYQPKWTSTHYTLLDLKNLSISPTNSKIRKTIIMLLKEEKGTDGGINPSRNIKNSDVCLSGMFLNYASYFEANEKDLMSIIDFLLSQQMKDGGFNCYSNRKGARHSSLHTTLSVLEGILEYRINGYKYRVDQIKKAEMDSREFILQHRFFKSDKTQKLIKSQFLRLSYPARWYYDILRALDYFRLAEVKYDERMQDAIDIILKKRDKDNRWHLQSHHKGHTHFEMEKVGAPSRWNTLRALRVLNYYKIIY